MVPRADIVAVDSTSSLTELSAAFKEAGHSRLPVYKETLDDPTGMVHIKDLLPYLMLDAKGRTNKTYPDKKVLQYIKREVLFVPPSMLAQDLLRRMQGHRIHMAVVVDEYGGTDGLVTIEDLIETIVGDIDDEHDERDPEVQIIRHASGIEFEVMDADSRRVKRLRIADGKRKSSGSLPKPLEAEAVPVEAKPPATDKNKTISPKR